MMSFGLDGIYRGLMILAAAWLWHEHKESKAERERQAEERLEHLRKIDELMKDSEEIDWRIENQMYDAYLDVRQDYELRRRRAREEKAEPKPDYEAMFEAEKKKLVQVERLLAQERQYTAKLKADADRAARSWCRMYYGAGPADCELCLHREPDGSCEYRVGRLRNG